MQILLAPSKTMTMARNVPSGLELRQPYFDKESSEIVDALRQVEDMSKLMHISDSIAARVNEMYQDWGREASPALFAYVGDVYRWFFAETLSVADIKWANDHLFIMSGLYGALRPLDLVSPYRLEMKFKLSVAGSKDLYDFWGSRISDYVDSVPDDIICNLSSDEYARVVTKYTNKRVVTPVFMDHKADGTIGTVPIYSKMMRGVMARWMIDNRIDNPDDLSGFSIQGYSYDEGKSRQEKPVFYRKQPKPIRF